MLCVVHGLTGLATSWDCEESKGHGENVLHLVQEPPHVFLHLREVVLVRCPSLPAVCGEQLEVCYAVATTWTKGRGGGGFESDKSRA